MTPIQLPEPQRGKDLLVQANETFVWNERAVKFAPLLTDGLVFTYPVLLLIRYLIGTMPGKGEMKYGALYVFCAATVATIINIVIQLMVDKQRPEWYIDNAELLIMDHLPTAPFPSDHAAVWCAVAMATLLWATHNGHTGLTIIGVFLLVWSVIMSLARVGVAIHRPTDVIAGFIIGILVAVLLHQYLYTDSVFRSILTWLIWIQEWMRAFVWISK